MRASELRGRGWLNTGGRDLALKDLHGKIVLLDFWSDFRGRILVLDFWSSLT